MVKPGFWRDGEKIDSKLCKWKQRGKKRNLNVPLQNVYVFHFCHNVKINK